MMLNNILTKISSMVMRPASSVFSVLAEGKPLAEAFSMPDIAGTIVGFIGEMLYFVVKWMLYFVDILFFYVQELAGLNMDTSSLDSMVSRDSDMIFNFLQSESIDIAKIVRRLIGLAIILIIIFSAIAIVRNQYRAIKSGQAGESPMSVMRTAFKSLIILIVTPMIAIIGIVASNLLLKSLYNATNVSGASSLGTKIFSVSSTSANLYRQYADDGMRIPITFDFSKEEEILESYKGSKITSKMAEYLTSTNNAIYATYLMFNGDDFTEFGSLTTSDTTELDKYHDLYDSMIGVDDTDVLGNYKRIRAYREEYYVMADVIDFAINTSTTMYFKTIEEVLNSIAEIPSATEAENLMNDITDEFSLEIGTPAAMSSIVYANYIDPSIDWSLLRFTSNYYGVDKEGNPSGKEQIQYNHVRGTTDEASGAVYVMAIEKQIEILDVTYSYYYPLTIGYSKTGGGRGLESEYISRNQIVVAKGIFNEDKYPTAIRKSADGSEIQFYRNGLETVTLGESGNFITTEFVEEESQSGIMGVLNSIVKFFQKLFDPSQWIPSFKLDEDAVMTSYTKVTKQANSLAEGKLSIGYLFSDNLTSALSGGIYGLKLYNLFNSLNLNYLALVMGALIMTKICFLAIFALIKRIYDLFMIIIIYPITCATMPFDDGASYSTWMTKYLDKLFLAYGLLLGINFIFLLFPAIESIELFKPEDLTSNIVLSRFSSMFGWLLSVNQQTKILNLVMALLFELVLFTYIESGSGANKDNGIIQTISRIINPDSTDNDLFKENPGAEMMRTAANMTKAVTTVTGYGAAAAQFLFSKNKMDKLKQKIKGHAPGSALFKAAEQKRAAKTKKKERDEAYHDLKNAMNNPETSTKDIEESLKRLQGSGKGGGGKPKPAGGGAPKPPK